MLLNSSINLGKSLGSSLSSGLILSALTINSLVSSERLIFLLMLKSTSFVIILSINYASFFDYQGATPKISQQNMIPKEKMSVFRLQTLFISVYGDMYIGEPTLYSYFCCNFYYFIAKPKSASLAMPFVRSILLDLRSLWITLFSARNLQASRTSTIILIAASSLNSPLSLKHFQRSPSQQYSVIMQQLFAVVQISMQFSTLGCFNYFNSSISFKSICLASQV